MFLFYLGYPRSVFSSITICLRLIAQQLRLIAVIKKYAHTHTQMFVFFVTNFCSQYRNYNSQTRVGFNVGSSRPITPNKSSSRARTLPVLTPAISLPTPLLGESSEDGRELSTRLSGSSSSSSIYGNKGGSGFGKSRPLVYKDVDALSVDDGEYNNLSNASNDYDAAENIFKDSSYDDGMYSDDIIDIVSPKKH